MRGSQRGRALRCRQRMPDKSNAKQPFEGRRRKTYEALLRARDPDAVHELIVREGPEILDQDIPYLLVAARHQAISSHRRQERDVELTPMLVETATSSLWDPFERASEHETLGQLARALGELPLVDALIVWLTATGVDDAEIEIRLKQLGESISPGAIRLRRHRARKALAEKLGTLDPQ